MNSKHLHFSAISGILSPIFGFFIVFIAISYAPWFSWTNNALSDLGRQGTEAIIFNNGLMITGSLILLFSRGLFEIAEKNFWGKLGSIIHVIASLSLFLIGLFNININPWHFYVSVGFFVTLPIAIIIYSIFLYQNKMTFIALMGWIFSVTALLLWTFNWSSVAIPEAASAGLCSIWHFIISFFMWNTEKNRKIE
ncbi:DUF998 domain-containing protein [Candidatus Bathyarchaeota archaeon]|nr:DUF998 domain-containing protein [Candidatus Bathyarchaeota archaeon]